MRSRERNRNLLAGALVTVHFKCRDVTSKAGYPMFIECEIRQFDGSGCNPTTWWWRLKSRNGKIVATSETYSSRSVCKRVANNMGKKLGLRVKCPW